MPARGSASPPRVIANRASRVVPDDGQVPHPGTARLPWPSGRAVAQRGRRTHRVDRLSRESPASPRTRGARERRLDHDDRTTRGTPFGALSFGPGGPRVSAAAECPSAVADTTSTSNAESCAVQRARAPRRAREGQRRGAETFTTYEDPAVPTIGPAERSRDGTHGGVRQLAEQSSNGRDRSRYSPSCVKRVAVRRSRTGSGS